MCLPASARLSQRSVRLVRYAVLLGAAVAAALLVSPSAAVAASASITGHAFVDVDEDGSFSALDAPLTFGVTASSGGRYYEHVYPDASGKFSFLGLPSGQTIQLSIEAGFYCEDIWEYNWLGEWVDGGCPENDAPSKLVVLGHGESAEVDLFQVVSGTLQGGLWLDGVAPPDGTVVEIYGDDGLCASGTTEHVVRGAALVSRFDIPIGTGCAGNDIDVWSQGDELATISWKGFWTSQFKDWLYQGDYYAWRNMADDWNFQALFGRAFGAAEGSSITAIVGDTVCGHVKAQENTAPGPSSPVPNYGGLAVVSHDAKPGCGTEGADVKFCIDGWAANSGPRWSHSTEWALETTGELCDLAIVPDGNCDGVANSADVLVTMMAAAGGDSSRLCLDRVDSNCNQHADSVDALSALRYIAQIDSTNQALNC